MAYRLLDHTADLGIVVEADDLGLLFSEAVRAFTDCVTPVAGIGDQRQRSFRVASPDLESLLVDWLNELLFVFETEGELFSTVDVEVSRSGDGWQLAAAARGERFDAERHPLKVPIKAVTYHRLEVAKVADGWRARVIFDI